MPFIHLFHREQPQSRFSNTTTDENLLVISQAMESLLEVPTVKSLQALSVYREAPSSAYVK